MEEIHKRLNDIHTFHSFEGEVHIAGTDEKGIEFSVTFDAYDFINCINKEQVEYIKKQLIKHIKKL
ncbi:MAG: hypothetical protein Tp1124DCM108671_40 [Prokaryotic dsDNA virus sp.]|nr:MAG: hypothetical protein Tp1125DCM102451_11 [Prokaryotic dsDNA virus sp.]QDP65597.1 MAG: hypothetical protein Tp1124DCM108671_40 [Prokaryotic dsDNA virus sp.]|tara:strand:- start:26409 stop:26606 length:198 start_codon:yes stop_codon:yes gene_type:complete